MPSLDQLYDRCDISNNSQYDPLSLPQFKKEIRDLLFDLIGAQEASLPEDTYFATGIKEERNSLRWELNAKAIKLCE